MAARTVPSSPQGTGPVSAERGAQAYAAINKTTARTLRILTTFLENPEAGYRVSELCRLLDMPKQTMIRALRTLQNEGYICKRVQGAGYELGYRIIELGNFDQVEPDLLEIAMPIMQRMRVLTGETVAIVARVGDHTTLLEHLDGSWPLPPVIRKGRPMPLNIGPSSCAVLAFLSDPEIHDFIARHTPLPAITPNAITDPEELWRIIHANRSRGYGIGTVMPGITTIGFPIFGADNRPHGAVSLIGLSEEILGTRVQGTIGTIKKLIEELNEQARLFHASSSYEIGL